MTVATPIDVTHARRLSRAGSNGVLSMRSLNLTASRRGPAGALLVAAVALGLSGCAGRLDPYETTGSVPEDYRTNHPILIEEQVATIDIPVSANDGQLTQQARANVGFFAQGFLQSRTHPIAVIVPSGSPNQAAADLAAVEIMKILQESGVQTSAIDYRVYRASADERIAPVRLAYSRIAAYTAPCRPWSDQITVTSQNSHYGNFGCASQQNLAAMVNNPLDLLYPRAMSPADATRRSRVLDLYRSGASTASANSLTGGTIAGVGQ